MAPIENYMYAPTQSDLEQRRAQLKQSIGKILFCTKFLEIILVLSKSTDRHLRGA